MAILKTDYKDDILDTSQNTKRKYAMTENQDNTVSFDDETEYTQEGDNFGAQDINATNAQVNTNTGAIADINDNLSGFKFYPTGTQLVALVADDSFYKDANGKYVLADSATGQSMIDNVTYKALASTEDCRGEVGADSATPFSSNTKVVTIYLSARGGKVQKYAISNQFIADLVISNTTLQKVKCGHMPAISTYGIITNVTYNINYPISETIGDLSSGQLIYNLSSVRISKETPTTYRIFADVSSSTAKTGALATTTVTTTFEWLVDFDEDTVTIVNDYAITGNTSSAYVAVGAGLMINS